MIIRVQKKNVKRKTKDAFYMHISRRYDKIHA